MGKYRKKPVVIEAWQWPREGSKMPFHAVRIIKGTPCVITMHDGQSVGLQDDDWVIPEPDGIHFYPCKPEVFEATYEKVEED